MPPRLYSRHTYTEGVTHVESSADRCSCGEIPTALPDKFVGVVWLTDRVPFRYRALDDNVTHIVGEGDTLWTLASRYFEGVPRPAGLWWVIADFQPEPIFDPTIQLAPGTVLVIPSLRTVLELVFDERRRREHEDSDD